MTKVKDENFYQIQGWYINKLKLKGVALSVYAIIYGFCQDGESVFNGSRQYLSDFTGTSKPTIDKALKELCDKDYIKKETNIINGVTFNKYSINFDLIGSKETLGGSKETLPGGSKETLPNNNNIDINNNIKNIVEHLNLRAGTFYKCNSDKTIKTITARLKEGFTFENFKTVIDKKWKEWKGTEFEKFMRPETLFGNKFESYLNAKENNTYIGNKPAIRREYDSKELNNLFDNIENVEL